MIFEKQISNICSLIGETHNYVFVDGPVRCGPAKGVYLLRDRERDQRRDQRKERQKVKGRI